MISLSDAPYAPETIDPEIIKRRQLNINVFNESFHNMLRNDYNWRDGDLMGRMKLYYKKRTQYLCKGIVSANF